MGFDSKTVQKSALCRSRRELSNEYLLAKFGFDTAENEPCKVCPLSAYRSPRYGDVKEIGAFCSFLIIIQLFFAGIIVLNLDELLEVLFNIIQYYSFVSLVRPQLARKRFRSPPARPILVKHLTPTFFKTIRPSANFWQILRTFWQN